MKRARLSICAALLGCTLLAGCKSAAQLEVRRLPVHVAIVPIGEPRIGQVTPGEFEGAETGLRLDLDCDEISRAVTEVLEQYCFSCTTLLEPATPGATPDALERERALVAAAREQGADWILELGLRYDAEIYRKSTSTFWLNYPLFLFAGPSMWFIPDNAYFADVELTARVYDLNAMHALGDDLGDPAAEVISFSSRFAGTELTFTERSGGAVDYATGILIPSGHLSRESEDTREAIHAEIVAALRAQVVQRVQSRRDDLVRTDPIVPIFIEPDDVSIVRRGGVLEVEGRVLLRDGSPARRVRALHLDAGAERVRVEPSLQPGAGPAGYAAFRFDVPVGLAVDARFLRIECEAGSRDKFVRSYTFRIPPDPGSDLP